VLLKKAIEGFLLQKSIEGLSQRTLDTYAYQLHRLADFLDNPTLTSITTHDLKRFFHHFRSEFTPQRWNGDTKPLTGKTLRNYWISCRSLFAWAESEFEMPNPMTGITMPKVNSPKVEPLTEEEVKAMLRVRCSARDHNILLVLLDTGIRSGELCGLKIRDVDLKSGKMNVLGKGSKERTCYLGNRVRQSLWRYIGDRDAGEPLFPVRGGRHLTAHQVWGIVSSIGKKANVANARPHRFRHTFAIQFLRNGGDIFTLQMLLGHSSLEMVKHYAKLAAIDAEQAHRRASPADRWLR